MLSSRPLIALIAVSLCSLASTSAQTPCPTACATIVNRIPDLINAAPGFTTTGKMPTSKFRAKDLGFYVK